MKPYILILCANLKGNIGDYAILEAMGVNLAHQYNDHKIKYLYHGHKGIDPRRIEPFNNELIQPLENAGSPPFYRRPKWFRFLQKLPISKVVIQNLHSKLIDRTAARMLKNSEFSQLLSGASAVYFAGGAQWGRGDLHLNMFAQLTAAMSLGCHTYAYPFSLTEQTVNCVGQAKFTRMIQQLESPMPVRDALSFKILDSLGVEALPTCDIVWSMAKHIKVSPKVKPEDSKKVCLCVTRSGGGKAQEVVQVIRHIQANGFEPIVLSTCEIEDADMIKEIEQLSDIKCITPDSWKQAIDILAEARFVITNRLHCIIFSSLAGTAVIPISNRAKTKAFVRDANLPCYSTNISDIGPNEIRKFDEQAPLIIERIKAFKNQCQDDISQLLPKITRSLDS